MRNCCCPNGQNQLFFGRDILEDLHNRRETKKGRGKSNSSIQFSALPSLCLVVMSLQAPASGINATPETGDGQKKFKSFISHSKRYKFAVIDSMNFPEKGFLQWTVRPV